MSAPVPMGPLFARQRQLLWADELVTGEDLDLLLGLIEFTDNVKEELLC